MCMRRGLLKTTRSRLPQCQDRRLSIALPESEEVIHWRASMLTFPKDLIFGYHFSSSDLGYHGVNGLLLDQIDNQVELLRRWFCLFSMIILGLDIGHRRTKARKIHLSAHLSSQCIDHLH